MKKTNLTASALLAGILLFLAACGNSSVHVSDEGDAPAELLTTTTTTAAETPADTSESAAVTVTTDASETTTVTEEVTESATESEAPQLAETTIDADNTIVSLAVSLLGIDFTDGGTTPETGFDNSGFIYYVLRENGYITCPRQTSEQAAMGTSIGYSELKPGDLAFFSSSGNGKAEYGGIYIGGGILIYSPMPGQVVKEVDITSSYWVKTFVTAVSL